MSLVSDSSNGGFAPSCLYMSRSLSSRLFSIEHMIVPTGLCSVVCVCVCVCVVWDVIRVRIGGLDVCLDLG